MDEEPPYKERKQVKLEGPIDALTRLAVNRCKPGARTPTGAKGKVRPKFNRSKLFKEVLKWAHDSEDLHKYLKLIRSFPERCSSSCIQRKIQAYLDTEYLGYYYELIDMATNVDIIRKDSACMQEIFVACLYINKDEYYLTNRDFSSIRCENETLLLEEADETLTSWERIIARLEDQLAKSTASNKSNAEQVNADTQ